MADHSNVVAFPAIRNSQNVIRLTKYTEKRSRLDRSELGILCLIEQSLYQQLDAGQAECARGFLPHEDGQHKCNSGTIWYYYSRAQRRYVLLDFEFNPSDGGQTQDNDCCRLRAARGGAFLRVATGRRLTALLTKARLGLFDRIDPFRMLLLNLKQNRLLSNFNRFSRKKTATINELDIALIRSALNASVRFSINTHLEDDDIPSWSVMRKIFDAPKQLEGSYARSMLAGEMICRLARLQSSGSFSESLSDRRELIDDMYPNIRAYWCNKDLFLESQALIRGVSLGRRAMLDQHSRYYSTCSITNNDFIEDDRCLDLLKSEMTLFLACAVNMRAGKSHAYQQNHFANGSSHKTLHKFALICQFVKLSNFLFRNRNNSLLDTSYYQYTIRNNSKTTKLKLKFIPVISDFGLSTSIIAESLIKFDSYIDDPSNMETVADRMISLVGSILETEHDNENPN